MARPFRRVAHLDDLVQPNHSRESPLQAPIREMRAVSSVQSGKFKYLKLPAASINASPRCSKTTEAYSAFAVGDDLIVF